MLTDHEGQRLVVRFLSAAAVQGEVLSSSLPADVQKLIIDHISSVEQLEVLLLLYRSAMKEGSATAEWSAMAVGRELRIDVGSASDRLADLAARGFLSARGSQDLLYRYDPKNTDLDRAVGGLDRCYPEQRVTVINLIFSKPIDKIRTFADAFKLKEDN